MSELSLESLPELLTALPADFGFHPLQNAQTYMGNLNTMSDVFVQMHSGYNVQIQSGVDAATTLSLCQKALTDNLEASNTHLPLQTGQANKILKSQGLNGQAFWGGEWEIETTSFDLFQLDNKITLATTTVIDVSLVIPEKVGMHVLLHNSLQSIQKVRILNPTGKIIGINETWLAGENIAINPGETFQAFCTDITPTAPIWELF